MPKNDQIDGEMTSDRMKGGQRIALNLRSVDSAAKARHFEATGPSCALTVTYGPYRALSVAFLPEYPYRNFPMRNDLEADYAVNYEPNLNLLHLATMVAAYMGNAVSARMAKVQTLTPL